MFTPEQTHELAKPLAGEHVKKRDQGRNQVSYIEGWHAIAEANRIFGFDGWTRETVMSECCHAGEYEKAVWEKGQKTNRTTTSFRCSYRARVRVTALGIVREGSGHGHGFADNPGEAHESAEKEAETDAMKRALMTFGNPFGLALYDKMQAEVAPANPQNASANGATRPATGVSAPTVANGATGQNSGRSAPIPAPQHDPFAEQLSEAAEEFDAGMRKKISEARLPSKIDEVIKANGNGLARLKGDYPIAYADLIAFSNMARDELLVRAA